MRVALPRLLIAATAIALGACVPRTPPAPSSPGAETPARATPAAPLPTEAAQERGADILQEIEGIAEQYDRRVEQALQAGSLAQIPDAATGETSFDFVNPEDSPLYSAWDTAMTQIQALNREWMDRFGSQVEPPVYTLPNPRPASDAEIQRLIERATDDYLTWLEEDDTTGSFVLMFDPYENYVHPIRIGDSYAEGEIRWAALLEYRLALLAPPLEERRPDLLAIERVFAGEAVLVDVGVTLPYDSDRGLHLYRVGDLRVLVDPRVHRIIMIDREAALGERHEAPDRGDGTAETSPEALEQRATEFVSLAAPGTDLARLTPVYGQKGENSFFRWEDRGRPLLDDGRSYPFIQVALDAAGELLNFYNTLF